MTPTPADCPFLRAIIDAPDDDLPRLVYADALDAGDSPGVPRDPERAEFIRVQVALARLGSDFVDYVAPNPEAHFRYEFEWQREVDRLSERQRELLERASANNAPWWQGMPPRYSAPLFRRGFITEVTLTAADWLARGDAILDACPIRGKRYDEKPHYREFSRDGLVRLTDLQGWSVETRPTDWHATVAASITVSDGGGREVATFAVGRAELARCGGDLPSNRELVERALAERWPGVNFQLPTAVRPDRLNWTTIAATTPRRGTGGGGLSLERRISDTARRLSDTIGAMERMARLTGDAE